MSQMGGRSAAAVTFQSLSRLFSVSPHLSLALMDCLTTGGGAAASDVWGINCTEVWIWDGFGGGVILSLISYLAWSFAYSRLMLERASTALAYAEFWARSQCKSGVTLCYRPKDAALAMIRFHAFTGVRKGDLSNGCISVNRAIVILATVKVLEAAAASGSLVVPGPGAARDVSSSATVGVTTS